MNFKEVIRIEYLGGKEIDKLTHKKEKK